MQNLINVQDYSGLIQAGDWAPAFKQAIKDSITGGHGGVFVPADPKPYTVKKPGLHQPSIDLLGIDPGDGSLLPVTDFSLTGEGYRSVIQMAGSGGNSSWAMIHIGGHAANITIRDLFLDGNRTDKSLLPLDEQTHLIRIGGSDIVRGGAKDVRILNCTLTRAFGDGVAILPSAEAASIGEEVSNVRIAFCDFTDNHRSGVSNQRSTDLIQILHNYFERNRGQDVDFEPTGNVIDSGPSRYLILGNTFIHTTDTVCVTLSGVSGDIPASNNTFAYNQIRGGTLGMINAQYTSIVGNYIEGGLTDDGTIVRLFGKVEGVRFADNHVVRPAGAKSGSILAITSAPHTVEVISDAGAIDVTTDQFTQANHGLHTGTGPVGAAPSGRLPAGLSPAADYWIIRVDDNVFKLAATPADALALTAIDIADPGIGITAITLVSFPRGVDVHDNRFHTYVPARPEVAAVIFTNAQECSFRNNEIHSYSDITIPNAIRFDTSAAILVPVKGWDITGNRFGGHSSQDGGDVFTNGIEISPIGVGVESIRINFNNFRSCASQISWTIGAKGAYCAAPMAIGNDGDGVPHKIDPATNLGAIRAG
jgi:hypothetical protein